MKLIAGLGNPGEEYAATRHNVGFMLIDALAARWEAAMWKTKWDALVAEARFGIEKILLVKPLTYMNESGRSIGPLLSWYKLDVSDLILAHDDIDLPMGSVRIRKKGSAGGHNGMKSVLYHVKDENFTRIRIGIGRPAEKSAVIRHVLSSFSAEDAQKIREEVEYLLPAVECIVTEGVDIAMNRYNPKRKKKNTKDVTASDTAQGDDTGGSVRDEKSLPPGTKDVSYG